MGEEIIIYTNSKFQSTPPARGATPNLFYLSLMDNISIHAPREGGDCSTPASERRSHRISIHAPREGGDYYT